MAGMAMAVQLFNKIANKFEQILFPLLDLPRSMYGIHIVHTIILNLYLPLPFIGCHKVNTYPF